MWDAALHRQNPRTHRRIFFSAYRWGSVHRISPSSDIIDLQACLSNREHGLETLWENPELTPAEGGSMQSPQGSSGFKCLRTGIFWTRKTLHESVHVHARAVFSFLEILCLKLRYVQCMCLFKGYLSNVQQHKVLVQPFYRQAEPSSHTWDSLKVTKAWEEGCALDSAHKASRIYRPQGHLAEPPR